MSVKPLGESCRGPGRVFLFTSAAGGMCMSRSVAVRLVLVFVGILGLASIGQAQTGLTGAVDGTISDEAGKPIGGVKVTLTGSKLMGAAIAESEPNGEYHFSALNPGPDF